MEKINIAYFTDNEFIAFGMFLGSTAAEFAYYNAIGDPSVYTYYKQRYDFNNNKRI